MRRLDLDKTIGISAMTLSLTVLMLYCASIFPSLSFLFCILALFLIYVLGHESLYLWGIMVYFLSALLSALLSDGDWPFAFYLLFGHYGLFRAFMKGKHRDPITGILIRMIYEDLWILGALLLVIYGFSGNVKAILPQIPLWLLVLLLQLGILCLDLLYGLWQKFYQDHIRNSILPRK